MKRLIFSGLLLCLLMLSSSFLATARAEAHMTSLSGTPATATPSPISLSRLKDLVRQTLGQQAVDDMGRRITQPMSIHSPLSQNLSLNQTRTATTSRLQANGQEQYYNSSAAAGYSVNAEGVSWVDAVSGSYNVAAPTLPAAQVTTAIIVQATNTVGEIYLGVDQTDLTAILDIGNMPALSLFHVNANDQITSEIYLDSNTNKWLVFIEDVTTRTAFGNEYSYATTTTRAGWITHMPDGGSVPSMYLIGFTNAHWESNWAGWQPLTSSAEATYTQWTLYAPGGGVIWPTEPDSSGTSFTLIPCPSCS